MSFIIHHSSAWFVSDQSSPKMMQNSMGIARLRMKSMGFGGVWNMDFQNRWVCNRWEKHHNTYKMWVKWVKYPSRKYSIWYFITFYYKRCWVCFVFNFGLIFHMNVLTNCMSRVDFILTEMLERVASLLFCIQRIVLTESRSTLSLQGRCFN